MSVALMCKRTCTLSPHRAPMIRPTSVLGPRLWSGLHVRGASVKKSFPHSEEAGRFDEADRGSEHTWLWEVGALATWIDKCLFVEEVKSRVSFHASHGEFFLTTR